MTKNKNIQTSVSYQAQQDKMAFVELIVSREINLSKEKTSDLDDFLSSISEEIL